MPTDIYLVVDLEDGSVKQVENIEDDAYSDEHLHLKLSESKAYELNSQGDWTEVTQA